MGTEEPVSSDESHVVTEAAAEKIINNASVFRYPFQTMNLSWLDEYIDTCLDKEDRLQAAMCLLNVLMVFTIMHEDPFLEDAALQFYNTMREKSNKKSWPSRTKDASINFDVTHHIFETICVTAKYPNLESTGKVGLLKMTEKLIKDIVKTVETQPDKFDNKKVSGPLTTTLSRMQALRKTPESLDGFDALMSSLKALFFCFSPCVGIYSTLQDINAQTMNTYVCCEGCSCYAKLRSTYTLFIRDVEKTKIIDCLLMMAIKNDNGYVSKLAEDLFARFDCRSLFLEKPVRRIQNGAFFMVRIVLFDAIRHVNTLVMEMCASPARLVPLIDNIILALYITRKEIKDIKGLNNHVVLVDCAIATAERIYPKLGTEKISQELQTLKDQITNIFICISAPEFHLAVHSKDPLVGKGANVKCGNSDCPGNVKEMLKCSGCRVTFYCSVACQRKDWKTHQFLCREMGLRKLKVTPSKIEDCPIQTLKPAIFS